MPSTQDVERLLAAVPLFEGFSKRERLRIAEQMKQARFNAGEVIVKEGAPGVGFFVIVEGSAKVVIGDRARRTLSPGDFFGEISLLDGGPRSATVRADTGVTALTLSSWNFLSILEENWPMAKKVMGELCRRVRESAKDALAH